MAHFSDLGFKYPDLVYHIWEYYTDKSLKTTSELDLSKLGIPTDIITIKSAFDFFITYKDNYSYNILDKNPDFSYNTIAKISDKLWEHGFLIKYDIGIPNLDGANSYYVGYKETGKCKELLSRYKNNKIIAYIFNSLVYGFKYIYKYNKENILPIYVRKDDKQLIGTCFKTIHGIVTAKHCITKCDSIEINGIKRESLVNCNILTKDNLDLVVIQPNTDYHKEEYLLTSDGFVLDEIMVMGYPNHCGFNNFVTATIGSIAAIEKSYLTKYDLMLLTSKVKGGNSGGPVFNEYGYVVGIVTETPNPDGEEYDQFGYGLAMPQYYIEEIVNSGQQIDERINFK
jgi:hypothetical protein